ACRDNPLARSFASKLGASRSTAVGNGLAAYSAVGTGTLIAFATAPGAVALDGRGANSPFTTALTRHLRTAGLEVRQMLTPLRAAGRARPATRQIPWDNSSLLGEVYLAGPGKPGEAPPAAVPVAAPPAAAPSSDDVLWSAIKDSSVPALFDEFVRKFPSSGHAEAARTRAAELKKSDVAMLPPGAGAEIPKAKDAASGAVNAPIASFLRSNTSWTVTFSFAEPTTAISWRLGETGNFRETGFIDTLDPRTKKRMPNPSIQLDADQPATTIYVRYV